MPINTGGVSSESLPEFIVILMVSWILCIILGLLFSYIAIRKHNKKANGSKYIPKIRYREMFNPMWDIDSMSFGNMLGGGLLAAGYAGLCLMAFAAVVFWITDLIMG